MNDYSENQKKLAAAWKEGTKTLPEHARAAAPYVTKDGAAAGQPRDFCLPADHAALNLLSDVREQALALFAELEIPWHAGTGTGPSNHLLSSQVQCVNALTSMVTDPERIRRAFAAIDVGEVLQVEPGRFLTFEYIGPKDYLNEAPAGVRVRGAHCTSVDAAFLHRAPDGATELVLVEWKYTESYRLRSPDPVRDAVRRGRYLALIQDPEGPVRSDVLAFEHLLDEPLYQLVRQQLLAHELEKDGVADRVRVGHVLAPANEAYQQSLHRPEQQALGATVSRVCQQLLRKPGRFTSLDPAVFLDPDVTSAEYCRRYSDGIIRNRAELYAVLDVDSPEGVEDWLEWDGWVDVHEAGVSLVYDCDGTGLSYPFALEELVELERELTYDLLNPNSEDV